MIWSQLDSEALLGRRIPVWEGSRVLLRAPQSRANFFGGRANEVCDGFRARAVVRQRLEPKLSFGVQAAWLEDRPLSALAERFVRTVSTVINAQGRYSGKQ